MKLSDQQTRILLKASSIVLQLTACSFAFIPYGIAAQMVIPTVVLFISALLSSAYDYIHGNEKKVLFKFLMGALLAIAASLLSPFLYSFPAIQVSLPLLIMPVVLVAGILSAVFNHYVDLILKSEAEAAQPNVGTGSTTDSTPLIPPKGVAGANLNPLTLPPDVPAPETTAAPDGRSTRALTL